MARAAWHGDRLVSVFNLMRDGRELAGGVTESAACRRRQPSTPATRSNNSWACARLEEELVLPFTTRVFGLDVRVRENILRVGGAIGILDLPLPERRPEGSEWRSSGVRQGRPE